MMVLINLIIVAHFGAKLLDDRYSILLLIVGVLIVSFV